MGSLCLFEFALFRSGAPSGRRVHSGSRGWIPSRLGLVGFIRGRVDSLMRAKVSSG